MRKNDFDYVSNVCPPSFPNGLDVSIINYKTLEETWQNAKSSFDKEHVVTYIQKKEKGNTWIKKKKKKKSEKGSVDLSEAREVDVNKNGTIDAWLLDENNNGIYEIAYADKNEDGIIEIVAIDKNEDENFEIILFDTNNNGNADEAEIDEDEDGKTDVIAYDFNEDGEWDKFENI